MLDKLRIRLDYLGYEWEKHQRRKEKMMIKKYGTLRIELEDDVCASMQRNYAYHRLGFTPKAI
ncbi:hypothetical protein ACFLRF_03890 [Candidatus Altiarchaeota archaeon]